MSARLRGSDGKNKIARIPTPSSGCCSEQVPWFSFAYLTTNSRYNLQELPSGSLREKTLWGLYSRLRELSGNTWLHWGQNRKHSGFETMRVGDLKFSPSGGRELSKDTTIYIFRFETWQGSNKGRIIGFKDSPCSVFHVIGFDVDFSAYEH